jgi:hypothetical protein
MWDSHPNLPVKFVYFEKLEMGIASPACGDISLKIPFFNKIEC